MFCQTTQHLQQCGEVPQHGIQPLVVFTTQLQVHVCKGKEGGREEEREEEREEYGEVRERGGGRREGGKKGKGRD